ncbi:MAG TPA: hypothetical protein VGR58_07695 [Candidatus Acidoferrum sp.]|nr:hypothetical protein [Candidatus Acidoferrum sp.]
MIRRSLFLVLMGGLLAALCQAQGEQQGTQPPANQPAAPAASGQTPPAASKPEKTKKVWTNDEVGDLQGPVSVVGTKQAAERTSASSPGGAVDARRGKILRYRAAIAALRKKIDAADRQIAQYKNFKADDGSPNGGINPHKGYSMMPLDEQVKQLEEKKKQMLAQIEDLENQAKKEGIEPGELR